MMPFLLFQSTHPRGVRPPSSSSPPVLFYFNPRTHVGCDRKEIARLTSIVTFQSTHPRGVRLSTSSRPTLSRNFNPRTHVGCDTTFAQVSGSKIYFNPRTHVGCDRVPPRRDERHTGISIHAPTWGATYQSEPYRRNSLISIHAPTWGATLYGLPSPSPERFQSTHPRGVRL